MRRHRVEEVLRRTATVQPINLVHRGYQVVSHMAKHGMCLPNTQPRLGMAVGKFKRGDEAAIRILFEQRGWMLFGPDWFRARLGELAGKSYRNHTASVVAKLLLRKD
ncbi:MAG: hypothetical protein C4346_20165 [Chloroflexota bacterium]